MTNTHIHIHECSFFWLGTGTSIKSGRVKLFFSDQIDFKKLDSVYKMQCGDPVFQDLGHNHLFGHTHSPEATQENMFALCFF